MISAQKLFPLGMTTTVAAAALTLLTGCGSGSDDGADGAAASPAAKGAVTAAQAAKILDFTDFNSVRIGSGLY